MSNGALVELLFYLSSYIALLLYHAFSYSLMTDFGNFLLNVQVSRMQVFSSWMHFCAVRIFAESILRYGLPPSFLVRKLAFLVQNNSVLIFCHWFTTKHF